MIQLWQVKSEPEHRELKEVSSVFHKREFQEALSLDMAHTGIYVMQIQRTLFLAIGAVFTC